ncbi:DUF2460 domain-containing protein [Candidatus Fokinia crypta]|uniref:Family 24 glycoside hydrolase n=1 Tax=Candidatus Fokinia crypta TaxID=1920990 RepID=A0ABZ0UP05_9RICK|nr:DUF2460 domain-containing protein [Candidatus Fokinia cryptica]WPX97851.1 Putative family 24 glycoside hydrolase [Candidatus Fokinia cryptica]
MNKDFIDIRLPTSLITKAVKCVEYVNMVHQMLKHELNDTMCVHSRMRYIVTPFLVDHGDVEELVSFFRVCRGSLYTFRFKDISDYKAIKEIITYSDEKRKEYHIRKRYYINRHFEFRYIKKIVPDTVEIFINNEKVDSKRYEVDHNNGIISFYDSLTDDLLITCSFEFDVLVRFVQDSLRIEMHNPGKFHCDNIELIEVI